MKLFLAQFHIQGLTLTANPNANQIVNYSLCCSNKYNCVCRFIGKLHVYILLLKLLINLSEMYNYA